MAERAGLWGALWRRHSERRRRVSAWRRAAAGPQEAAPRPASGDSPALLHGSAAGPGGGLAGDLDGRGQVAHQPRPAAAEAGVALFRGCLMGIREELNEALQADDFPSSSLLPRTMMRL